MFEINTTYVALYKKPWKILAFTFRSRLLENGESFESNLFKENNSQTRLYYTSMLDYHLVFCETKEPPSAEQYARQCKRSANQLMISLLVLYFQYENNYDTYYH